MFLECQRAVRRTIATSLLAFVGSLLCAAGAFAGTGGLTPESSSSPNAHGITQSYYLVAVVTMVVFAIVEGVLIVFVIRYRRGKRTRLDEGPQIHGSTRLEVIWTVLPVVILAVIGSFIFYLLPGITDAPPAAAADQTRVHVSGRQFYWQFTYPNGAVSIDTLVAPADQVVNEDISAPTWDVIHSWWVPDLGGKFDAIPGRVNKTWFKAPAGVYAASCYELCGIQHALMHATVKVVPRAEYDAFIAKRAQGGPALGQEEWQGVCQKCHRLDHTYIGPALGGNPLLADRKAIEVLLRNGQGQMPSVGRDWTSQQLDSLIAYTKQFATKGGNG
jgi:cytochrome c oxidase subunit 2